MSKRHIRRKKVISQKAKSYGIVIAVSVILLGISFILFAFLNPFNVTVRATSSVISLLAIGVSSFFIWRLINVVSSYSGKVEKIASSNVTKTEGRYKALIQNSQDLISIIDLQGIIQYQSPSTEKVLGYSADELVGQTIFELIHAEDQPLMRHVLEQKSTNFFFQYRIQHHDGSWLFFEAAGSNQMDNPLISGFVINSRDISDRKREEEARKQKEYAAMRADAQRENAEREKRIIEEGKAKLEEAYHIIEHKNQEITDSINYAFRIQTALLPSLETVKESLPNAFVMWMPKDIVSGDFYWFAQRGTLSLIAAADCTGHGVPGAFMTMIGNTLLNRIVLELGITSPEEVLNNLHRGVRTSLKQDRTQSKDGMDIVFATIDHDNKKLHFAAANNPLIRVRNGEFEEFKADKFSIGGQQWEDERRFTLNTLDIEPGDRYYLYSDGFQDQFGGDKGRKYMTKRFKQFLADHSSLSVEDQKEILQKEITQWMGTNYEQIDDILVIGLVF